MTHCRGAAHTRRTVWLSTVYLSAVWLGAVWLGAVRLGRRWVRTICLDTRWLRTIELGTVWLRAENRNWCKLMLTFAVVVACGKVEPSRGRAVQTQAPATTYTSVVHQPARLSSVDVGADNQSGDAIRVRCETCHALRKPSALPSRMDALKEFHTGLTFAHGTIECSSCHAVGQPPRLHLASGEELPMTEALRVCSQCHGPQFRDFEHGAHGGMTGYWDTSRGPRVRNHCIDCHDPHSPKISPVVPLPRPRDRFFSNGGHR